jgi:hypothetical protein
MIFQMEKGDSTLQKKQICWNMQQIIIKTFLGLSEKTSI